MRAVGNRVIVMGSDGNGWMWLLTIAAVMAVTHFDATSGASNRKTLYISSEIHTYTHTHASTHLRLVKRIMTFNASI